MNDRKQQERWKNISDSYTNSIAEVWNLDKIDDFVGNGKFQNQLAWKMKSYSPIALKKV